MAGHYTRQPSGWRSRTRGVLRAMRSIGISPLLDLCSLISVLTLLLLAFASAASASQPPRHILLFYAGDKDLPMNRVIDGQFRARWQRRTLP